MEDYSNMDRGLVIGSSGEILIDALTGPKLATLTVSDRMAVSPFHVLSAAVTEMERASDTAARIEYVRGMPYCGVDDLLWALGAFVSVVDNRTGAA